MRSGVLHSEIWAQDAPPAAPAVVHRKKEAVARETAERHHSEWPELRELARKLRVRVQDVAEMVEDSDVLDMCVGVQIPGGGMAAESDMARWKVEWIG
jgi:hypothetical protein